MHALRPKSVRLAMRKNRSSSQDVTAAADDVEQEHEVVLPSSVPKTFITEHTKKLRQERDDHISMSTQLGMSISALEKLIESLRNLSVKKPEDGGSTAEGEGKSVTTPSQHEGGSGRDLSSAKELSILCDVIDRRGDANIDFVLGALGIRADAGNNSKQDQDCGDKAFHEEIENRAKLAKLLEEQKLREEQEREMHEKKQLEEEQKLWKEKERELQEKKQLEEEQKLRQEKERELQEKKQLEGEQRARKRVKTETRKGAARSSAKGGRASGDSTGGLSDGRSRPKRKGGTRTSGSTRLSKDQHTAFQPILSRTRLRSKQNDVGDPFVRRCENLLRDLVRDKMSYYFREPVDPRDAEGYYDVISEPMDLSSIQKMISAENIRTPKEVYEKLKLVWKNAMQYNGKRTDIYRFAVELRKKAREGFEKILRDWCSQQGVEILSIMSDIEDAGPSAAIEIPDVDPERPQAGDAVANSASKDKRKLSKCPKSNKRMSTRRRSAGDVTPQRPRRSCVSGSSTAVNSRESQAEQRPQSRTPATRRSTRSRGTPGASHTIKRPRNRKGR